MKLRDLFKTNAINDGTRTLLESILIPEVAEALKDWKKSTGQYKYVLIGGVALSYYVKPRATTDADLLFLSSSDIPKYVEGFKRTRPHAFMHKKTNVEIETVVPETINISQELALVVYNTANIIDGIRIASPSGIVALKLARFKLQDQADIESLYNLGNIDLTPYPIPDPWKQRFNSLIQTL